MQMNSENGDGVPNALSGPQAGIDVRHMTQEQLAGLGVNQIAYIKPVMVDGVSGFAIHAADGTPMAVAGDKEIAVAAVTQHEMHALSVH